MRQEEIEECISDTEILSRKLEDMPHTYKTLLGDFAEDKTMQFKIRRKMNNHVRYGFICKSNIPGTRFGQVIFYTIPKKYHILVVASRIGSEVFCVKNHECLDDIKSIKLLDYYKLNSNKWDRHEDDIVVFTGKVLLWI